MTRLSKWIVVGGGASGLATAYFLRQLGLDSVIVERDRTIGGRMGTVRLGDRTLDAGGKNIGRRYTLFRGFARSLGAHPLEHFGLNSSQAVGGRVRTFDAGARWRTMAALARGVRPADAMRFGSLLWRVKSDDANGYLGSTVCRDLAARYDEFPASHYFSPEFCRRIIRPMSVRMNGAEPDEIYMGNLASNARMILDTYDQFTHGLAPLLACFAREYDVRSGTAAEELLFANGRAVGVRVRSELGATSELLGCGVVLAAPANVAARLTASRLPALARELGSIAYHPVALVVAEYDRPVFTSAARAFVFDERHPVSNAGAYSMRDRHLVRYTFSGRAARGLIADATDETLVALGEAALSTHVPLDAAWRRRSVTTRFATGLCAYAPHHATLIDRIHAELDTVQGLYVTGDYLRGASIEACFRAAYSCAHHLAGRETRHVLKSA